MGLAPGGTTPSHDRRPARVAPAICLLAAAAVTAGCASPLYRTHADLPARKAAIRAMGLLPPALAMYEEQVRFKLVPHDDWSPAAASAVRDAFVEEMAAAGFAVAPIDGNDPGIQELADLYGAVDLSIGRHAYDDTWKEAFPEKVRALDYSLGPAQDAMRERRVDAVWIITGFNFVPTTWTRVADTFDLLMAVASAAGGGPGVTMNLMKLELRAALVDGSGAVLFYCKVRHADAVRAAPDLARGDVGAGGTDPAAASGDPFPGDDIRDPRTARRYVRALIAEYRKATAP